jgi:hypothetical protein
MSGETPSSYNVTIDPTGIEKNFHGPGKKVLPENDYSHTGKDFLAPSLIREQFVLYLLALANIPGVPRLTHEDSRISFPNQNPFDTTSPPDLIKLRITKLPGKDLFDPSWTFSPKMALRVLTETSGIMETVLDKTPVTAHGDLKPGNIVFHYKQGAGIIDWATVMIKTVKYPMSFVTPEYSSLLHLLPGNLPSEHDDVVSLAKTGLYILLDQYYPPLPTMTGSSAWQKILSMNVAKDYPDLELIPRVAAHHRLLICLISEWLDQIPAQPGKLKQLFNITSADLPRLNGQTKRLLVLLRDVLQKDIDYSCQCLQNDNSTESSPLTMTKFHQNLVSINKVFEQPCQ